MPVLCSFEEFKLVPPSQILCTLQASRIEDVEQAGHKENQQPAKGEAVSKSQNADESPMPKAKDGGKAKGAGKGKPAQESLKQV